jgi:formamidopyrimidine-DNA glycosylase
MPEVLEIRKYVDFLNSKLKNNYINSIDILKGRYKTHSPFVMYKELKKNLPLKVINVKSKGKFIYILLEKDFIIFNTLGLTGGWIYLGNDKKYKIPLLMNDIGDYDIEKYKKNALNNLNIEFNIDLGSMYFFDIRSYGTIKVVNDPYELYKKLDSIGPDIMDLSTTFKIFKDQILKKVNWNKPIGNVLVNQKIISGIGNYLRSDILWLSCISPFRLVSSLNDNELKSIYKNALLLTWGDYNYKKACKLKLISKNDKLPIYYNRLFFIYRQKTDIYNHTVLTDKLHEGSAERTIFWVKERQL